MGYKKSNPARTNLVLMVIAVALYISLDFIFLLLSISFYASHTGGNIDSAIGDLFAGVCGFWFYLPLVLTYTTIALSIGLWGRGVYGRKHELYTFAGFFFGIGGFVTPFIFPIFALILGSWEFMIVTAPLPLVFHSIGLYLFIKDIGGKLMGGIGVGITTFGRVMLVVFGLIWYEGGTSATDVALVGIIISLLISLAGHIILLVGFTHAFQWTSLHEPLLDEQQVQQMQMQQHQLHLQHETLEMQREQLLMQQETSHLIREQNRALVEAGLIEGIPHRSSAHKDHFHNHFDSDIEEW